MKIRPRISARFVLAALAVLALLAGATACGSRSEDRSKTPEGDATAAEGSRQPEGGNAAQPADGQAAAPQPEPARPAPVPRRPARTGGSHAANGVGESGESAPPAEEPLKKTPPEPVVTMVRVPEGKRIRLTLDDGLSTKTGKAGDTFTATVKSDIHTREHPDTVIPAGTTVTGTIVQVQKAKEFKGQAKLVVKFEELKLPSGKTIPIVASLATEGKDTTKRSVGTIAGSAAAGAILGKIIGKDTKDAAIGAVAGAAVGTGVVLGMKNKDVELPAGTEIFLNVDQPFEVPVAKPNA